MKPLLCTGLRKSRMNANRMVQGVGVRARELHGWSLIIIASWTAPFEDVTHRMEGCREYNRCDDA